MKRDLKLIWCPAVEAVSRIQAFVFQLKGNEGAVNFYRLCFRLVSQKSLEFFTSNRAWIETADETFGVQEPML